MTTATFTCDDQIRSNRTWYSADNEVVVYMDGLSRWWRLTEDGERCHSTAREAFSGIEAVREPEPVSYLGWCASTGITAS